MKSIAEHNLEVKVEALKFQLNTADQCIGHYKRMAQNQQQRINMLLKQLNDSVLDFQRVIDNHY